MKIGYNLGHIELKFSLSSILAFETKKKIFETILEQ